MTDLFGIPLDTLTTILLIITLVILVSVIGLALSNLIFFKIGVRNIRRRRSQMLLIVFALMLSTTLLTSVLATGNVITATVSTVAVDNLGNIDETVEGGSGDIGRFDDWIYYRLRARTHNNPDITGIAGALVERNLLLADLTSRQVRSNVTSLALIPDSEQGFGGLLDDTHTSIQHHVSQLDLNHVFLNHTLSILINAHAGDTLYLYSKRWPGRRYSMHVDAIVQDGGIVGQLPFLISNISTFRQIENTRDDLNAIYIANRNGAAATEQVTADVKHWIPRNVHVTEVKELGVQASQLAENIFSRIFSLFALFALAIGLLLIFLIFVLLAAERRAEMGMARAIGVRRRHLVLMYIFEGTIYDLLASFIGLLIGVGVGAALVYFLGPILARFNFPLKLTLQPGSLLLAYCLGVIFTFASVALAAWLVSRMTVVDALRNLPESERPALTLRELWTSLRQMVARARATRLLRRLFFEQLPEIVIGFTATIARTGLLPLLAGYLLLRFGLNTARITPFSLGLSLLIIGVGLVLKTGLEWIVVRAGKETWRKSIRRIFAAVTGLAITAYWALPFDVLAGLGLPRFQGGIEVFFMAAAMMVFGLTWACMANAELLVRPILSLCARGSSVGIVTRLAAAYPLHHRFRTGLGVTMFSLVIFAMTVMAVITSAMQNTYTDINLQTGGYDIRAVAYFRSIPDLRSAMSKQGLDPQDFSQIGVSTTTEVGVIQPDAPDPAWHIYPAQLINGSLLQGNGLKLVARAQGFDSDNAVWQALQTHSNYALIDNTALPYRPNSLVNAPVYDPNAPNPADAGSPVYPPGLDPYYAFALNGVYQGDTSFVPAPIWTLALQGTAAQNAVATVTGGGARSFLQQPLGTNDLPGLNARKFTVIGVVDNSDSNHFGLYLSQAAFTHFQPDPATPDQQTYYLKAAPGQDKRALSLRLGSAFLEDGLETTVLEDAVWSLRGPRILLSDVLLGVVGLTLLLGVAALAITGTRAVIERRQQIGMLRALGCKRRLIQSAFLCESFFIGSAGSLSGVILGLILSSNIFAVNFFEQFHTGLTFTIPWTELGLIVAIALLASLLASLLPAWQAGRVTPMEALRE
ncbi:MAG TPA: FtsX-like permease family protein [Ktedonobacteraceae bacterium]|nr:FtsX-like permease family protein [Ktedonobacteraceae bacterium]